MRTLPEELRYARTVWSDNSPHPHPLTLPHPPIRCRDLSEFFLNFERKEKITLSGVKNN